jgi:paraquat-inducible protein B
MSEPIGQAQEKRGRWAGWIWAVPIAALAIVGYLTVQQFSKRGPAVTITFATAGGVKAGDTKVQYQGLRVGEVTSVRLHKDLRHVDVGLRLDSDMDGHIGPGTRFWIAGQKPSLSNLGSLKAVLTGPFIGVEPHDGPAQGHFQGLEQPPVEKEVVAGTHFVLHAATLGSVSRGSAIYYRDLEVGTIESVRLRTGGQGFDLAAFVRAPFDALVHGDTRFWNAGAVQVSMAGPGPRLQMQSIPALFTGAVAFETPDQGGAPAADHAAFHLYQDKDTAEHAPDARSVRYRVTFDAAQAGGLDAGAPVMLAQRQVGSVVASDLQYDPRNGQLTAQVTLALEPQRIHLASGSWANDPRPQMNALLNRLIAQGLRASVGHTVPVVGSAAVDLAFEPKAGKASLSDDPEPQIPTGTGSDINGIMTAVGGFSAKLNAMPLDQIADEIHQTTQRLAALSQSPQLTDSLHHLDATMANVAAVSDSARGQIGPILHQLRDVAAQADRSVAAARSLISARGGAAAQPDTAAFGTTLYEVSRAARSLRELADYLDRHPEALLHGKAGGE